MRRSGLQLIVPEEAHTTRLREKALGWLREMDASGASGARGDQAASLKAETARAETARASA